MQSFGFALPASVQANYVANRHDYNAFYTANQQLVDAALNGDVGTVAALVGAQFNAQVADAIASVQQTYLPR